MIFVIYTGAYIPLEITKEKTAQLSELNGSFQI